MYVIQVDQQFWLKGIWRGWLTFCDAQSGALVYQTLPRAEKALAYYKQTVPEFRFVVRSVSGLAL